MVSDDWVDLASWWVDEAATDPAFTTDVLPLTAQLLDGVEGPLLDLGCGEGRMLRALAGAGRPLVGVDINGQLAALASTAAPVVRAGLPRLDWLREAALGGVYAVLVVEHIADLAGLCTAAHRVVRDGGAMVVVANHPAFTAPGASPIADPDDGEVLWRWGNYFTPGPVPIEIGGMTVSFHHRAMGEMLTTAAGAGWELQRLIERPLSAAAIARMPGYRGQEAVPRLVGFRWRRDFGTVDP